MISNQKRIPKSRDIENSIVQIFSDHTQPSYEQPWSILKKEKSSGTGFCIKFPGVLTDKFQNDISKGKCIITNAHCVHNSTYITIRKRGAAFLYKAKIEGIIYECDLAILSIDVDFYKKSKQKKDLGKIISEFWVDLYVLEIGGLPSKLDTIYVYGYPLGGYNISITTGAVNRIQIIQYFDAVSGIAIQIDAPINFGNSGGPVVDVHGNVIGVAFSGEDDRFTQNMGYIIPTTLVRYFLSSIEKNKNFKGLSSLSIEYQGLNNVILREYFKLKRENTGILVTSVEKFGSSDGLLENMDIITHINEKKVDNDGTMSLQDIISDGDPGISSENLKSELLQIGEVAPFTSFISLKKLGSIAKINVLRNGKPIIVEIPLQPKQFLVPILEYQIKPSYYVIAGMVFIPLTLMAYIEKKQNRQYVSNLYSYMEKQLSGQKDEQIIILSQIFVTELTEDFPEDNYVLKSVNEIKISNLEHLYQVVQKELKKSEYIKFDFQDTSRVAILGSSDIIKHQEKIIFENIGDIPEYLPSF